MTPLSPLFPWTEFARLLGRRSLVGIERRAGMTLTAVSTKSAFTGIAVVSRS